MKRKNFLKTLIPLAILPVVSLSKSSNIRFPFKDSIGWEVFGGEEINKNHNYKFADYMKESFNVESDEFKIDFESGKILDFDCVIEYKEKGDFSKLIFYMEFDICFTHSGWKSFRKNLDY